MAFQQLATAIGSCTLESFPNGVGEAQATEILVSDLHDAERSVVRMVKVQLTQGQFDALVDFVFNMGSARLHSSTLLADLNAGSLDAAAQQILLWDHAGLEENAGLKARREAEFHLFSPDAAGHREAA